MKVLRWLLTAAVVIAVVVVLWNQGQKVVDGQTSGAVTYVLVFLLVFGDAICPVLPGETTLNAASILASTGKLNIWVVIFAGALGAVTGDSVVYWVARRARGRLRVWMDKAAGAKSTAKVLGMLRDHGPVFLLFGRYIPGVRFALNATLGGVVKMPYGTFVKWSAVSGAIWSAFTCACAYFISTALAGYPLLSLIITGVFSAVLITSVIWIQSKFGKPHRPPAEEPAVATSNAS
jgi:membrane-associated protein